MYFQKRVSVEHRSTRKASPIADALSISIILKRGGSSRRKEHMTQNAQAFSPVVCRGLWVFSESPVTIPQKAQWEHVIVEEHHLQPPCACEAVFLHHAIYIALKNVVMQRRFDSGPLASYTLRPGDLFVSLANMSEWRRQDDFNDLVLVFLEPALFTQMAQAPALNHAFDLLRRE